MAVRSAREMRICPGKGPGDNTAHRMRAGEDFARAAAVVIEQLRRDQGFMRRDLKHAVRRGIDDQLARFQMLAAIIQDDLRAGIGPVAQHAAPRRFGKSVEHLRGEPLRIGWQRLIGNQSADLPVPDGGILAPGALHTAAKGSLRGRRPLRAGHPLNMEKAQFFQRIRPEGG